MEVLGNCPVPPLKSGPEVNNWNKEGESLEGES